MSHTTSNYTKSVSGGREPSLCPTPKQDPAGQSERPLTVSERYLKTKTPGFHIQ